MKFRSLRKCLAIAAVALTPTLAHADPVTIVTIAAYAFAAAGYTAVAAWLVFAAPAYGAVDTEAKGDEQ